MKRQKKDVPLQAPHPQAAMLVIQLARSAPLQNLEHAKAADKAIADVEKFFGAFYGAVKPVADPAKPGDKPGAAPSAGK